MYDVSSWNVPWIFPQKTFFTGYLLNSDKWQCKFFLLRNYIPYRQCQNSRIFCARASCISAWFAVHDIKAADLPYPSLCSASRQLHHHSLTLLLNFPRFCISELVNYGLILFFIEFRDQITECHCGAGQQLWEIKVLINELSFKRMTFLIAKCCMHMGINGIFITVDDYWGRINLTDEG